MKFASWMGALLLLAVTATASFAAGQTFWIGGNAGFALPTGDFSNVATSGFGLGVTGDIPLQNQLSVGGEIGYYSFGGDHDFENATSAYLSALAGAPVSADFTFSVIPIIAHVKYAIPVASTLEPYVVGGIGLYNFKSKLKTNFIDSESSESKFGFKLGGGAMVKTSSNIKVGGELLYNYISTDPAASTVLIRGVGSSRVDLQACKLEYSIVSPK